MVGSSGSAIYIEQASLDTNWMKNGPLDVGGFQDRRWRKEPLYVCREEKPILDESVDCSPPSALVFRVGGVEIHDPVGGEGDLVAQSWTAGAAQQIS